MKKITTGCSVKPRKKNKLEFTSHKDTKTQSTDLRTLRNTYFLLFKARRMRGFVISRPNLCVSAPSCELFLPKIDFRGVERAEKKFVYKRIWFFFLFFILAAAGFAQSGVSLAAEIQSLENAVSQPGITSAQKYEAYVNLASLRQLSGDIEGAARNWLDAAGAIPGQIDVESLLNCAYCLAAMGEWDRAAAALEPLLYISPRARFLDISIKAINTNDLTALGIIADHPDYSQMKSEILFMLWKLSDGADAEIWRQRLVTEFPLTAEGMLAAGQVSSAIVKPSPFWLFLGGLDSLLLAASEPRTSSIVSAAAQTVTQPAAAEAVSVPAQSTVRLQTGIFSREVNAQTQASALRQAGFSPSVEQRMVNGAEMWAVTVPEGSNQNRTISELRAAGFESFPLR